MQASLFFASSDLNSTLPYSSDRRWTMAARTSDMTPYLTSPNRPSRSFRTHLHGLLRKVFRQHLVKGCGLLDQHLSIRSRPFLIGTSLPLEFLRRKGSSQQSVPVDVTRNLAHSQRCAMHGQAIRHDGNKLRVNLILMFLIVLMLV